MRVNFTPSLYVLSLSTNERILGSTCGDLVLLCHVSDQFTKNFISYKYSIVNKTTIF